MNSIRAIETIYKGYRFRSRMEARWAVFFDAMGFKWVYEPEGYEGQYGTKYLPDFLVHGFFAEVKAHELTQDEIKKATLAAHVQDLIVLVGNPDFRMYDVFYRNFEPCEKCENDWNENNWAGRCENCHIDVQLLKNEIALFDYKDNGLWRVSFGGCVLEGEGEFDKEYKQAVYASRAARFEHREFNLK